MISLYSMFHHLSLNNSMRELCRHAKRLSYRKVLIAYKQPSPSTIHASIGTMYRHLSSHSDQIIKKCQTDQNTMAPSSSGANGPVDRPHSQDQPRLPPKFPSNRTFATEMYTVPNLITISRIIASPYLGWCIYTDQKEIVLAGVIVAGFSDWLDGYIARFHIILVLFHSYYLAFFYYLPHIPSLINFFVGLFQ